jgi:hypothetical protein
MSNSTDLRPLFVDYALGVISAEQLQALEAALREDSDLRRDFIEYMNIDSALGDMAALSEAELAEFEIAKLDNGSRATGVSEAIARTNDRPTQTFRVVAFLGALAATLLIAAFSWFTNPSENEQAPVATLVTDVDAVLSCDGQPCKGTELRAGKYRLDRGLVLLQFGGGVMVYLEAPARFDAVSNQRVELHSGRLSANVPPEGVGFTVETPEAEVIDFGTEFSVDVEPGTSEVHVFEGLVRVQPRSRGNDETSEAFDLRALQAVRIEDVARKPVSIELATDRFIRTFDETRRKYSRTIKQLSPVAFYRMAIRGQGLTCVPPEYSGIVLTGDGNRPPHASGVFAGGSLRVLADSSGRGGLVESPPPLQSGEFTLAAFVFLESRANNAVVATNIQGDAGSFALALNERGFIQATVRDAAGKLRSASAEVLLPLRTWCHIVMIVDGDQLRLYNDGRLVASTLSAPLANNEATSLWFGTDSGGLHLWDGRIDEVALFDKALGDAQITELYQAALEQMGKSE